MPTPLNLLYGTFAAIVFCSGQRVYEILAPAATQTTPTYCVNIKNTGSSPVNVRGYHPNGHDVYPNHQFVYNLADQGHLTTGDISKEVLQKFKIVLRGANNTTATVIPGSCETTCTARSNSLHCYDRTVAPKCLKDKNPLVARCNSNKLPKHRSKPRF